MDCISTDDFRRAAKMRVPRFLFDYAEGGALGEVTLQRNLRDLADVTVRQRVLQDVGAIDTRTSLFGQKMPLPLALGPIGIGGMFRRRGEAQAARAAQAHGIPFTLSTVAICSMAEVRDAAPNGQLWFQLYVIRDRAFMHDLLDMAKAAGVKTLVFTVDMPVPGIRYRDTHSGMSGTQGPRRRLLQAVGKPCWSWDVGLKGRPHALGNLTPVLGSNSGMNDYMAWLADNFDPSIRWADLDWLRQTWDGSLIIKGILDPDDAEAAVAAGADGLVVSNHGGRQLDGALSSARALPHIAQRVGDRITILADGGVRTGLDVLRMLGLGARGVLLGRAWLYALGARGEAGVAQLLTQIQKELVVAMTLTGVKDIASIDRSILV